jgi:hypothetical protein
LLQIVASSSQTQTTPVFQKLPDSIPEANRQQLKLRDANGFAQEAEIDAANLKDDLSEPVHITDRLNAEPGHNREEVQT